ncbi:YscO family type III secretion system apparatus protein [uncultured Aureimonas sp.]|uniref:type III secretion system stalk subunit SctO n=1 Tax=uncultured Aureimonas sp. TaxID=1604662 RepID=UPI0025F8380B|nr:YscO family type III secretion system apparatus protein [uncultured Aureimonas sp.]
MIGQMRTLLKVKDLKQEQALRELQRRRSALAEAEARRTLAQEEEAESRRTLDAREDAIYAGIIGRVVNLDVIDDTKGSAEKLRRGHGILQDVCERAVHVEVRMRDETERQGEIYRAALRVRDKYTILTERMTAEQEAERAYAEESEIEELFARARPGPGSRGRP